MIDLALADDRVLELGNLIALRQVRIEIVLAVEDRALVDLRLQAKPGAHRLLDAFLVDHRQHAGHGRIDERDVGVRRIAEGRGRTGEQLRIARHLGMDFHADDDLPVAGGAWDIAFRIGNADIDKGHGRLFCKLEIVIFSVEQLAGGCKACHTPRDVLQPAKPFAVRSDMPAKMAL